jgi:hypothetical protein
MATEEPFHTDNTGLGDLESEQLYLEVKIYSIFLLIFFFEFYIRLQIFYKNFN